MKIIDRYLLTHLLLPFVFCFASLFLIFVVVDLFGSIDDFARAELPALQKLAGIARIYLIMLGERAPLIIPFAFFLACVWLLTNLSAHKELVAMMSAGISLARLVVPFLLVAAALAGVEFYLYLNLAPTAANRRETLMREWERNPKPMDVFNRVVYQNPETGVMWYVQQLDMRNGTLTQAEINIPSGAGGDAEKYFVARGNYHDKYWDLVGIRKITFNKGVATPPQNTGQLNATFLTESPRQMAAVLLRPDSYPWGELREFITSPYQPSAPRMAPYKTEHYRRLTNPLLAPLLCLFAFAAGIVHDRKSRAVAIMNCMLILMTLFLAVEVCVKLGNKGRVSPEWAGWFPIVLYGGVAVALFVYRVGLWWELVDGVKSCLTRWRAGSP